MGEAEEEAGQILWDHLDGLLDRQIHRLAFLVFLVLAWVNSPFPFCFAGASNNVGDKNRSYYTHNARNCQVETMQPILH